MKLLSLGPGGTWTSEDIPNVLVAPVVEVDSNVAVVHEGHRAIYHLGIPKDDDHVWEGQLVQFKGCTWSVVGIPTEGLDHLIPGPWNKKVTVELYRSAAPDLGGLWRDEVQLLSGTVTKDVDGYDDTTANTPKTVVAIFCEGVNFKHATEDDKTGMRRTATVEIWDGDYEGETRVCYQTRTYNVTEIQRTGRGTLLLKLEEVWR